MIEFQQQFSQVPSTTSPILSPAIVFPSSNEAIPIETLAITTVTSISDTADIHPIIANPNQNTIYLSVSRHESSTSSLNSRTATFPSSTANIANKKSYQSALSAIFRAITTTLTTHQTRLRRMIYKWDH